MGDVNQISLRSSIEEVAQCPVCLKLVKPPVTLCDNGHGMCTACKATFTKCPTCGLPFCSIEPRILNEILQKLHIVCKYYDEGCRLPATDEHKFYCKFRTVKCAFPLENNVSYCDIEMPAEQWVGHVYLDDPPHLFPHWVHIHDEETFKIPNFNDLVPTKSIFEDDPDDTNIFIFYYTKSQGSFCLYIKHFPMKKPTVITYFTLSFGKSTDKVMYKYKIKATTMISLERDVKVEENVYCMRVPVEELEKLVDEDGYLYVSYEKTTEPL